MAVLPGVLECRYLRRTVQVRLGTNTLRLPSGTPILFALAALRSVPQAGSQFRGLTTAIHEISGLGLPPLVLTGSASGVFFFVVCIFAPAEWSYNPQCACHFLSSHVNLKVNILLQRLSVHLTWLCAAPAR